MGQPVRHDDQQAPGEVQTQLAGGFPVLTQHALMRLAGVLNLHDMAVTPTRLVEAFR